MDEQIILSIETAGAAQNIAELKERIKTLKEALEDENATQEENARTVTELRKQQNALRDAMNATSKSAEELSSDTGKLYDENGQLTASYNDLVHQMSELKRAWRATSDETERANLGKQISDINDQLKELDSSVGNYQRNVGNYTSVWQGMPDSLIQATNAVNKFVPGLGRMKNGVEGVNTSMKLMSTNPIMGFLLLLVPIINTIVTGLKENETAMGAIQKLMKALQPVVGFFEKILEKIAGWLSTCIDWMIELMGKSSGTFSKIVAGAIGVGNVLLQYLLTPIRSAIEAFKGLGSIVKDVVTGEFGKIKDDANAAWEAIKGDFVKGFSFKANFQAGYAAGEEFLKGLGTSTKKGGSGGGGVKEVAEEAAEELVEAFTENVDELLDKWLKEDEARIAQDLAGIITLAGKLADANLKEVERNAKEQLAWNNILTEDEEERARRAYEIQADANQQKLDLLRQFVDEALANGDMERMLSYQQQIADLEVEIEQKKVAEEKRLEEEAVKNRQEQVKKSITILQGLAGATASIIGSIADMYEADEKNAERNAQRIKGLRIAEATINTITGVTSALAGAFTTHSGPWDIVLAGIQAATIAASGAAQIAKIKQTPMTGSASSVAPAAVTSAPMVQMDIPEVRQLTSASEEERLNQIGDQKVYILSSDIEASQNSTRVQVQESSF